MRTERRISAGGVIFRPRGGTIEVALIATKGGTLWGLPKGTAEQGENLARTAHREVREETGLDGKILCKIGNIQYFFTTRDESGEPLRCFKIVFFFLMEYLSGDVADHDSEVDECRWVPMPRAIRTVRYEDERKVLIKARKLIRDYQAAPA